MEKIAFVFPGQASQYVGMGKEAKEHNEGARSIFERADKSLGFQISKVCFEGPEEKLRLTTITQPAILTATVAIYKWVKAELDLTPTFVAGHSLGEYAALVAADAITFEDAVKTVHCRGNYMEEAVPAGVGTMSAIIGMEKDTLNELCKQVTSEGYLVELANQNSPGQIVISGTIKGVALVGERATEAGAKRVIPLNVSGPFHSSLMKPAAERLKQKLTEVPISKATIPLVANTVASSIVESKDIFKALVEQVASPVLWEESVQYMINKGVKTFIEIGPGTVIAGLIRKIDKTAVIHSVQDLESLDKLKACIDIGVRK